MLRAAEACTRVALLCRACRVCRVCRSCCTARRGVDAGGARVSWSVVRYASHSLWSVPSSPSRRVSGMWCCGGWWSGCALSGVCGGHATRHVSAYCENCHNTYVRGSRNARATSRDPPTATRRVSAFTPRVRSGQCRVAFSLTLSHAFRVRPLRLGATRALPALEASLAHTGTSGGPAAAGTQLNKTIRGSDLIQPQ